MTVLGDMTVLWIAGAGAVGACCRFLLTAVAERSGAGRFPWITVLINASGSLILGLLTGLLLFHQLDHRIWLIAGTGFCGGYTTFSTTSFETVRLVQQGRYRAALGNAVGTALLAMTAGAVGLSAAGVV